MRGISEYYFHHRQKDFMTDEERYNEGDRGPQEDKEIKWSLLQI
jgi:hypothetical protein